MGPDGQRLSGCLVLSAGDWGRYLEQGVKIKGLGLYLGKISFPIFLKIFFIEGEIIRGNLALLKAIAFRNHYSKV